MWGLKRRFSVRRVAYVILVWTSLLALAIPTLMGLEALGLPDPIDLEHHLGQSAAQFRSERGQALDPKTAMRIAGAAICDTLLTNVDHPHFPTFPTASDTVLIPGTHALRVLRGWYESLPLRNPNWLDLITLSRRAELEERGIRLNLDSQLPYFHEAVSSLRFSQWVDHSLRGHQLLMVTSLMGSDIPGMDGVLINEHHEPVGNYSLKTVINGNPLRSAQKAVDGALRFSHLEEWVGVFLSGRYEPRWLLEGLTLAGLTGEGLTQPAAAPRPYTLVIDIQGSVYGRDGEHRIELPDSRPETIREIQNMIERSRGRINRIVFMKGEDVLTFEAGDRPMTYNLERVPGIFTP